MNTTHTIYPACQYTRGYKNVLSQRCCKHPETWTNLDWRLIMDTLPPHAQKSKTPQKTTYSIYQYLDPRTGEILYIGLTSNPYARFKQHLSSEKGPLYSLARELRWQRIELTPTILETTEDREEAKELEKKWIKAKSPKLNQVHNQEEIERRRYEEEISSWMQWTGWTHNEAHLYLQYFHSEGGDTYDAIEYAVHASRKLLGMDGSFTKSEILHIALKYRGIEVAE